MTRSFWLKKLICAVKKKLIPFFKFVCLSKIESSQPMAHLQMYTNEQLWLIKSDNVNGFVVNKGDNLASFIENCILIIIYIVDCTLTESLTSREILLMFSDVAFIMYTFSC